MNCVYSAFVCQFCTVSNPHTTHLLTIHCCVCVFEVIWFFYYKEPRFRVGGSFTILVSESWKQSRSLAHEEESTSLSAWKYNTGAEQSIVVYCLRTSVLSLCMLSKPMGLQGITQHLTCHLVSGKFTHTQIRTPADTAVDAYTQMHRLQSTEYKYRYRLMHTCTFTLKP